MSNELAIPEMETSSIAQFNSDAAFKDLAQSSKFLGRLSLMSPLSDAVMEGKIQAGRWGLVNGKNVEDLGSELRCYVVALRLKAMDVGADPIVSYFNPASPEFIAIKNRCDDEKQGPLAGPEFLLYLPNEQQFCTFYMCSKTMRREAPIVKQLLKKPATFKITIVSNKKNKWHAPVITGCATPLDLPDGEQLKKVLHSFMNPPEASVVEATEQEKAATGGREV